MNAEAPNWTADSICLQPSTLNVPTLAVEIYERTCRTHFDAPGFCVLNAGNTMDSVAFRQLMVDLKKEMATVHESKTGDTLVYLSAGRYDQQKTTKPHLDGGPKECFLMIGYEPSDVHSELQISDYTRCAFDLGMSPGEFMEKHNPMFQAGKEMLRPYSIRIPCFSTTDYQIVCINNSSASFSKSESAWQGTLHTATILTPDESKRRVINSTLIASAPAGTLDAIDDSQQHDFVTTSHVRRRGHDNPHLNDDS